MLKDIEVLCHSSIRFNKGKVMYVDPFKINKNYNDADIVFITHTHYDHYSKEDIIKVAKENTIIVGPEEADFKVEPNKEYELDGIKFKTVSAYNNIKPFHPKKNGWVGYVIQIDGINYYIAGDTDVTKENKQVICDVAFVPVGGTYTMNYKEAADFINEIKPKIAVPIHYGSVVGTKKDAKKFCELVNKEIQCEILMKEE